MAPSSRKHQARPSLRLIADHLGVTTTTVSNAYNRPDQLSPALRARVFEAAHALGYAGPDPIARSLARGRAGAIGVLYSASLPFAFSDRVAVESLRGIATATEAAGLGLLLVPGSPQPRRDPQAPLRAAVDGFIVYSVAVDDPLLRATVDRHLPIVTIDMPGILDAPGVSIDDESAARAIANHILSLGHRRIGVLSLRMTPSGLGGLTSGALAEPATHPVARARLAGYANAARTAGLKWADVPVYETADSTVDEGRAGAALLLNLTPRPTAVIAMSDALALGALEVAGRLGIRVPEELSIVGFDDIPEASRSSPPLTTVHEPHLSKGLRAGELLVGLLDGEEASEPATFPTHVAVRASTAPRP